MTNWKAVSFAGQCECGSGEDVIKYENVETGEIRRLCNPCEQGRGA
jgi:hypothetical protein